ncbi:MAG: peptidoglycan-binding domain-containing protein [Patescibacteria group bacterium]|nr:peptidoglycan-binding domain-containing protein [Patescibacteria group bacterium]
MLEKAISSFQSAVYIEADGNFGQATRQKFYVHFGINLDAVPYTVLHMPDVALQPNGEIILWPPHSGIILPQHENSRTPGGLYRLLPTYMDWQGSHTSPAGFTTGPSTFLLKCLFIGTEYCKGYLLNTVFDEGLAATISAFQRANGLEADGCFGQETRKFFWNKFGRNLEDISRQVLAENNYAIQSDGHVIAWPPALILT